MSAVYDMLDFLMVLHLSFNTKVTITLFSSEEMEAAEQPVSQKVEIRWQQNDN